MKNFCVQICLGLLLAANVAHAQSAPRSPSGAAVTVTADNFDRAQTDMYFAKFVKDGALGKFVHERELPLENAGPRPSRDTLSSMAVFDLDAGPVRIILPNPGKRFMAMTEINEDHYIYAVDYGAGHYTFSKSEIGTRYVLIAIRTFVDAADPDDVKIARALLSTIKVQQRSPGRFEIPNWDPDSQKKVRDALLVLNTTLPDLRRAYGTRTQVDRIRHMIGTAIAWGGNPDKDVVEIPVKPSNNDGTAIYKLVVPAKVPVNAFWSVTVYDANGELKKNQYDAYSVNSVTAKKNADASVGIQFGGCDGKVQNCLPIMQGWTYVVRLYRPRDEVLNRNWKFPEAQPMN